MAATACGGDDFEAGLREVLGHVDDAVGQVRRNMGIAAKVVRAGLRGSGVGGPNDWLFGSRSREPGGWGSNSPGKPGGWGSSRSREPGGWGSGEGVRRGPGWPGGWGASKVSSRGPGGESGEGFGPRDRGFGGPRDPGFGGPRGRGFGGPKGRGHWGGGFGGPKGRGHWGGGFGGPWGGWWPAPPGPPGPARGPKASRGDVRAAILALLQEEPRNGYQIMSEIEERSGGAWRPSPGAVYPALQQLADEGLISGEEAEGRRTFRLTEVGREYIREHPERARGAWESAAQQEAWEVPGLFAAAAKLGGGIVQVAQAGTHDQILAAERLLERTRREIYRILAEPDEPDAPDEDGEPDGADGKSEPGGQAEPGEQDS